MIPLVFTAYFYYYNAANARRYVIYSSNFERLMDNMNWKWREFVAEQ